MTRLSDYYDRLVRFDWFYHFSEDGRAYSAGIVAEGHLYAISKESPLHKALYDRVREHYFSGPPFDNDKRELPPHPIADVPKIVRLRAS